ncbi:MAG TPA: hypothetical protein VIL79_07275 [Thermoleophilia bacterium]
MELSVSLQGDLALTIADRPNGEGFPTARLQRGLLLLHEGRDLAEEGVGFGVPVLKRGALTIFPGSVQLKERLDGPSRVIVAAFRMDLVERLAGTEGRGPTSGSFYAVRDLLAALHRRLPLLRGPLTAVSNAVRRRCGWVTTFEQTSPVATLDVTYRIESDQPRVRIAVDMTGLAEKGVSEVVMMNELGARHFDRYLDSDGARLRGRRIGTWREVAAAGAMFAGTSSGVAFSVGQAPGARLFRGRELVGSRLAWSGFGYSLSPARECFAYEVRFEKAP